MDLSILILKEITEAFDLQKSVGKNAMAGAGRGLVQGGVVAGVGHLFVKRTAAAIAELEKKMKDAKTETEKRYLEIEIEKKKADLKRFKIMRGAAAPVGGVMGATVGVVAGVPVDYIKSK